jgi:hypothetical protein
MSSKPKIVPVHKVGLTEVSPDRYRETRLWLSTVNVCSIGRKRAYGKPGGSECIVGHP